MTAAKVLEGMDNDKATLEVGDHTIELPMITGSEGELAIDISKLRGQTKTVTIDNGFVNTGSCTSSVTFLDGEKGILRYRGYPIEQLAEHSNFLEVAYLLYHGQLPTAEQFSNFKTAIAEFSSLPSGVTDVLKAFPKTTHPMAALASITATLPGFFPNIPDQNHTPEQRNQLFALLVGAYKQITANIYRHTTGKEFVASDSSKTYCGDFLNMMFQNDDPVIAEALDTLLILHADHEQNCSASTVRLVGSSHAHPFAAVSAGVSALWGPLHGGANQAVLEMLEQIQNEGGDYKAALAKAKDKSSNFRLMGFGHRVYKNFDPRAKIIKKILRHNPNQTRRFRSPTRHCKGP